MGDSPPETLRERHPDVAGSLFNLGGLRYNQDHYPEALDLLLEAESIRLDTWGPMLLRFRPPGEKERRAKSEERK